MNIRDKYYFLLIRTTTLFFVLILFFTFCTEDKPTEPANNNDSPVSGVISTGGVTEEISQDIGTGGGTINYKGTVVVTLNDDHNLVTSVDWTEDYTSFWQNNVEATSTSSFSGHDIPLSSVFPGNFQDFHVVEEQTCSRIDLLEYGYQNSTTLINQTLESHTCNRFSYIQVSFSEE